MKHVETFLILQFEVDVIARNQHVDDVVVVARYRIVKRRVSLYILCEHRATIYQHFHNGIGYAKKKENLTKVS